MMKKKEKKKRKRKEDEQEVGWPSPLGAPCAPPPPGMAYPNGNPLSAAPRSPPLLCLRSSLRRSTSLYGSLPLFSPSRSTAATVPFQIKQPVARSRRNRADGSEETAQLSGIDEETAE